LDVGAETAIGGLGLLSVIAAAATAKVERPDIINKMLDDFFG
jgi:hypothetical protein